MIRLLEADTRPALMVYALKEDLGGSIDVASLFRGTANVIDAELWLKPLVKELCETFRDILNSDDVLVELSRLWNTDLLNDSEDIFKVYARDLTVEFMFIPTKNCPMLEDISIQAKGEAARLIADILKTAVRKFQKENSAILSQSDIVVDVVVRNM